MTKSIYKKMDMLYQDAFFYIYPGCEKKIVIKDVVMQRYFLDALKVHMNGSVDFCFGLRCPCNRIGVHNEGRMLITDNTNDFKWHPF